jgi:hypothetical protein
MPSCPACLVVCINIRGEERGGQEDVCAARTHTRARAKVFLCVWAAPAVAELMHSSVPPALSTRLISNSGSRPASWPALLKRIDRRRPTQARARFCVCVCRVVFLCVRVGGERPWESISSNGSRFCAVVVRAFFSDDDDVRQPAGPEHFLFHELFAATQKKGGDEKHAHKHRQGAQPGCRAACVIFP